MKKRKQPIPTVARGIRLPPDCWLAFDEVIAIRGRIWLEKLFKREHKKILKDRFVDPLIDQKPLNTGDSCIGFDRN